MQEEVRDKSVALVINVGKNGGRMTASLLKWAMRQYMQQSRNPHIRHGKQTVKQLVRQGAGVQNIEITDKNINTILPYSSQPLETPCFQWVPDF